MRRATWRCPLCGNTDRMQIDTNGAPLASAHLTLICLARVEPTKWAPAAWGLLPEADDVGADGKVACAMQWDPNRE